jgi:hypothetical protein
MVIEDEAVRGSGVAAVINAGMGEDAVLGLGLVACLGDGKGAERVGQEALIGLMGEVCSDSGAISGIVRCVDSSGLSTLSASSLVMDGVSGAADVVRSLAVSGHGSDLGEGVVVSVGSGLGQRGVGQVVSVGGTDLGLVAGVHLGSVGSTDLGFIAGLAGSSGSSTGLGHGSIVGNSTGLGNSTLSGTAPRGASCGRMVQVVGHQW